MSKSTPIRKNLEELIAENLLGLNDSFDSADDSLPDPETTPKQHRDMSTSEQVLAKAMEIFATSIKPPQFSKENPRGWFASIESQFTLSGITVETTKLRHVIASLPSQVNDTFGHITWKTQFSVGDYDNLKQAIIAYFEESKVNRLNQVLEAEQLDDRTPSQFWLALKAKSADLSMSEDLLFHCWLKRLPSEIQATIRGLKSKFKIEELLVVANDMYEQNKANASVAAIANKQQDHQCCSHTHQRSKSPNRSSGPRQRSYSPNRSRQNGYREDSPYCWYHYTFGKRAHKCTKDECPGKNSGNGRQ